MKAILYSLLILSLTLLMLPLAQALDLTGLKLSPIIYEPGKKMVNHYVVSGTDKPIEVSLGGDLDEYVTMTEVVNSEFDLIIEFPEEYIPSGSYRFFLSAKEIGEESTGGVGSLLAVTKVFEIVVYAYDKFAEATLIAPNVNLGSIANLKVQVESKGYVDIDKVKAEVIVTNQTNQTVAKITTKERPLPALQTLTLAAPFNTSGMLAGKYHAWAVVKYDSKSTTAEASFNIGTIDLILLNYTSTLQPGFNDFKIQVKNDWGLALRNVYAQVDLKGKELLQTPTISLDPWQEGELKSIVKVEEKPGVYSGVIKLFFESEKKELPVSFTITALPEINTGQPSLPFSKGLYFLMVIIIILILIIIYFLIVRSRKDDW